MAISWDNLQWGITFGIVLLIIKTIIDKVHAIQRQPPGPWGIPLLGCYPFLRWLTGEKLLFRQLRTLSKRYGKLVMLKLGLFDVLYVGGDYKDIGDALTFANFLGRPVTLGSSKLTDAGETAIVFNYGKQWIALRKMGIKAINDFVQTNRSLYESVVQRAIGDLSDRFIEGGHKPTKSAPLIMQALGVVMNVMCFGSDLDPNSRFLKKLWDRGFVFVQPQGIYDYLPRFLSKLRPVSNQQAAQLNDILQMVFDEINIRLEERSRGIRKTCSTDFLWDAYEQMSDQQKRDNQITDQDVKGVAEETFRAGIFDMTEIVEWFLFLVAQNPGIQTRFYEELDALGRPTTIEDMQSLHYCRGCAAELLRYVSSPPLSMPHNAVADTQYKGYHIPKGTMVWIDINGASHDEGNFPDPEAFDPQRWLRADGSFNTEMQTRMLPFAAGKRRCPGETLARPELFLIITNLMRFLEVRLASPGRLSGEEVATSPYTIGPEEHRLFFKRREPTM